MMRFRLVALVLLMAGLSTFVGCRQQDDATVWYAVAADGAYLAVHQKPSRTLMVVRLPVDLLMAYRIGLQEREVVSDELGALQHLFGLQGDHYLRGSAQDWEEVTAVVESLAGSAMQRRLSVPERLELVLAHARVLSNLLPLDTLDRLSGPHTSGAIVQDAVGGIPKQISTIQYFDAGTFLNGSMGADALKQYLSDWTRQAVQSVFVAKQQ